MNGPTRRIAAADPGALRRRAGAAASLAAGTTWVIFERVLPLVGAEHRPRAALFGTVCTLTLTLVVAEPRRPRRWVTIALCTAGAVGAVIVSATLDGDDVILGGLLLALMFLSFFARPRGRRVGEIALATTMGLYFALAAVVPGQEGWFVLAAVTAGVTTVFWQWLICPGPVESIRAAGRDLLRRSADVVDEVATLVDQGDTGPSRTDHAGRLQRRLADVRTSRRAIESQFPAVLAPQAWTRSRLDRLDLAYLSIETGLTQMADAAHVDGTAHLPTDDATAISSLLRQVSTALDQAAAPTAIAGLAEHWGRFRSEVEERRDRLQVPLESVPWVIPALGIAEGGRTVARSAAEARALVSEPVVDQASDVAPPLPATAASAPASRPGAAPAPTTGPRPTTIAGLQAVLAVGVATAIGEVAGIGHVRWIAWTAFLVVAASAGESVRNCAIRIVATVLGAVVGLGLAQVLPPGAASVAALVLVGAFFVAYFAPVSYVMLVFTLNAALVAVFVRIEGNGIHVTVNRSIATLLGAAVAAIVALTVAPIKAGRRYDRALGQYLAAVADGIHDLMAGERSTQLQIDAARSELDRAEQARSFEHNPLTRSAGPRAGWAVRVAAIDGSFQDFALRITESDEDGDRSPRPILDAAAQRIEANLRSIDDRLTGGKATVEPSLADLLPEGAGLTTADGNTAELAALTSLHRAVIGLADDVASTSRR